MTTPETTHRGPALPTGASLVVRQDRRLARAQARSHRYLLIDIVAPTQSLDPSRRRPPVNLAFVLDRSGSMNGSNKLPLAKQAVLEAIGRLDDPDRFSVVSYDDRVDVVHGGSVATPASRRIAAEQLRSIEPRGNTNLHAGWLTGCEQVAAGLVADGVNRVLLLTDGLANAGVTNPAELSKLAFELRQRNVTTSTFGVGADFDERLLEAMADSGGGHFYFVGSVSEMRDHITSEVGETLEIVARGVTVEVAVPDSVRVTPLSPFPVERTRGGVRILLGDLVSGQVISLAVDLGLDYGDVGREIGAVCRIADRDGAFAGVAPASLTWAYADNAANDAQPRERAVDRVVARAYAERARQEAVQLNREGRYEEAAAAVEGVRRRVAAYAGDDPELLAILGGLEMDRPAYSVAMAEVDRKERYFQSSNMLKARTAEGRSKRS